MDGVTIRPDLSGPVRLFDLLYGFYQDFSTVSEIFSLREFFQNKIDWIIVKRFIYKATH